MMNSYPFIVACGITVMIIQTLSELRVDLIGSMHVKELRLCRP